MENDFAAESGHWYRPDGTPAYRTVGANGQERATTLRDARKHGYVPSVTTILKCAAKPGLERWKAEQVLMAGLTLSKQPDEPEASWVKRVWEDSMQQAIKAAERGTAIHAAIEQTYRDPEAPPIAGDLVAFVVAAKVAIANEFGFEAWQAERSFAHPLGYGGKVDLHSASVLLDVKTKDGDLKDVKAWDEHLMQTAAYAHGLGMQEPRCAILFVSRTQPAAKIVHLEPEEVKRGLTMFLCLLDYWKAANRIGGTR